MNRAKAVRIFLYSLLVVVLVAAAIVVLVVVTAPDTIDPFPFLTQTSSVSLK